MSRQHSTVSRRDFMRGLGISGVGLGLAALPYKDLDEILADVKTGRPWWIKEVAEPTVDIDWNVMNHKEAFTTLLYKFMTSPKFKANDAARKERFKQGVIQNRPGWTMKDVALAMSLRQVRSLQRSLVLHEGYSGKGAYSPDTYGAPAWQGSPEENTRLMQSVLHFFGSPQVGVIELNQNTKRLFSARSRFEAVDKPYKTTDKIAVIPEKCKYAVTFLIKQSAIMNQFSAITEKEGIWSNYGPILGEAGTYQAYHYEALIAFKLQMFLNSMGFLAVWDRTLAPDDQGMDVPPPAFGTLGGLAELGRAGYCTSPHYGNAVRKTGVMLTDMPLAPTSPINAGILKFCKSCKICANDCPSGSISKESEPSWEIHKYQHTETPDWALSDFNGQNINRPGLLAFRTNWQTCLNYGGPFDCDICQSSCPFSHENDSSIHSLVRAAIGTTPAMNGFFASMEGIFGYSANNNDAEAFWNRDLNTWTHDTIPGFGTKGI